MQEQNEMQQAGKKLPSYTCTHTDTRSEVRNLHLCNADGAGDAACEVEKKLPEVSFISPFGFDFAGERASKRKKKWKQRWKCSALLLFSFMPLKTSLAFLFASSSLVSISSCKKHTGTGTLSHVQLMDLSKGGKGEKELKNRLEATCCLEEASTFRRKRAIQSAVTFLF